jgi:hypothetical protein
MRTITTVLMSSMLAIVNQKDTARNRRQQLGPRHADTLSRHRERTSAETGGPPARGADFLNWTTKRCLV